MLLTIYIATFKNEEPERHQLTQIDAKTFALSLCRSQIHYRLLYFDFFQL